MRLLCRTLWAGLLALVVCPAPSAFAVEAYTLPPARTPAGQTNLTRIWTDKGGARLYWNTLVDPLQIRMAGARFDDPAAVPELRLTPPEIKPVPRRYRNGHKKVQARKAAPATVPRVAAPKGVGSAALMPPVGEKADPAAAPARNAASVSGALSASDASNSGRPAAAPASGATPLPYPGSRAWMEKNATPPALPGSAASGQAAGASTPLPPPLSATPPESTPPAGTAPH